MSSLQTDKVQEFICQSVPVQDTNIIYGIPRTYVIYKTSQIRHFLQNGFVHLTLSSCCASNGFSMWIFILPVELFKFNLFGPFIPQFWKCKIWQIFDKFSFWFTEVNAGRLSRA